MIAIVYFSKRPINSFVNKFLHKDFKHCFVVLFTDEGVVKVDNSVDKWQVIPIKPGTPINTEYYISVSVPVRDTEFSIFGLMTCVGVVKRIIGLNKPFILTPYQLFKELS